MTRKKKRIRDGEGTRARVIGAAEKIFAEQGFGGASIGLISRKSGVSGGLILHHYRSKDQLYKKVREGLAARYREELKLTGEPPADPEQAIGWLIRTAFNFFNGNPRYHRISLWTYLEGRTDILANEAALTGQMVAMIEAGQKAGLLKDDYDPVTLLVAVIGSIHYWIRYQDQFKKIFGWKGPPEEVDERFIEQMVSLITQVMIKPGPGNQEREKNHDKNKTRRKK